MGFMDELKKLTQPYGDDDDFYEGSQGNSVPSNQSSPAASNFENAFADQTSGREQPVQKKASSKKPLPRQQQQMPSQQQMPMQPQMRPGKSFRGQPKQQDLQVVLFNPKTFDEAGELASYLVDGRSMVMTLEGIPTETARRLLDFISGIAFALNAKITSISAKTFFVTPANVDLLDSSFAHANADADDDRF